MLQVSNPESLRAARRLKLFEPVEVRVTDGCRRGHLLDVSTSGALLHMGEPPAPGTVLTLMVGGRARTGKVAWSEARRCGVAFTIPLPAAELEALIDAADRAQR